MANTTKRPLRANPSLHRLSAELARLRARVSDLEDLCDLNAAITRNAGMTGVPWARAKKELRLA
jgi:hypothetical protein